MDSDQPETATSVVNDKRGAIMVLGIFFACVMIGWMWMLVGLGDAMIWRDRTQEAADAISYSASAMDAKGMNVISFVNIVMLILAGVYLLMAIVFNLLDLLHVLLGRSDDKEIWEIDSSCGIRAGDSTIVGGALSLVGFPEIGEPLMQLGSRWCSMADWVSGAWSTSQSALQTYEDNVMKPFMPMFSHFEDLVAYGTPWAGAVVGAYIGHKYEDWGEPRWGAPIGASMFPATKEPGVPGTLFQAAPKFAAAKDKHCQKASDANACQRYNGGDKREGLPVEIPDDGMSTLCKAAAKAAVRPIEDLFSSIPIVSTVVNWLLDGFADGMKDAYCSMNAQGLFPWDGTLATALQLADNVQDAAGGPGSQHGIYRIRMNNGDPFWGDPEHVGGPHTLVGYASNGNDWMQNWGFVFSLNRPEQSEKKVGVAGMDSAGPGGTWNKITPDNSDTKFTLFIAQSEFYFDCGDEATHPLWSDEECNGGGGDNLASYQMSWRARLRRVHGLSFTSNLFSYFWGGWLNSGFDTAALNFITGGAPEGTVKSVGQQAQNWFGQVLPTGAYGTLKDWAGDQIGGAINPATALPETIH